MSNFLRTIQQVTRDYVDSINHRIPSIKNGTVTATSSDGTATVRVDGNTATTGSVPSLATVKTGDRVKMVLYNRQLTILGAIQRTNEREHPYEARYLPNGTDLNNVIKPGSYRLGSSADHPNAPQSASWSPMEVIYGGGDTIAQLIYPFNTDTILRRSGNTVNNSTGTWREWKTFSPCPFPVGYIVTNQGQNPATQWPGTTWARYAAGRVLVGQDTGQTEFNTIGKTGGAKTHTLTINQIPSHNHTPAWRTTPLHYNNSNAGWGSGAPSIDLNQDRNNPLTTLSAGGGAAHNNLQPYAVVVHWRRTA